MEVRIKKRKQTEGIRYVVFYCIVLCYHSYKSEQLQIKVFCNHKLHLFHIIISIDLRPKGTQR